MFYIVAKIRAIMPSSFLENRKVEYILFRSEPSSLRAESLGIGIYSTI